MKIRVIGDLHGRDWWKRKVETGDSDLNIFLGDYVDSYIVSDEGIINNLLDIIEFKKAYEDKVILLLGNHEFNYISPYIGYCSGYRYSISNKLQDIYRTNLHLFKLNYNIKIYNPETEKIDRTYWFSHAGITSKWLSFYGQIFNNIENEKDIASNHLYYPNLCEKINLSIDSYRYLSQVMSISMCRGGSNFYGGPLWSDMLESKRDFLKYDPEIPLYDAPVIQYVGHTTVNPEEQTVFRDKDSRSEIHYCDFGNSAEYNDIIIEV